MSRAPLLLEANTSDPPAWRGSKLARAHAAVSAALVLAVVAGLGITGRAMSSGCTDPCSAAWGYQGCLSAWETFGVASLLVRAAGAWSPDSHELFGDAERARAATLVRSLYHVHARCMKHGGWEAVDFARAVLSHAIYR